MEEQRWLDAIQESMLVVLSLTRVLISCDQMTIVQSGAVLLATLIHSADLLALSHSLQYHDVIIERLWMYIGLLLLTTGLFLLAFIDTDGLTPPVHVDSHRSHRRHPSRRTESFNNHHLYPLLRVRSLLHGRDRMITSFSI